MMRPPALLLLLTAPPLLPASRHGDSGWVSLSCTQYNNLPAVTNPAQNKILLSNCSTDTIQHVIHQIPSVTDLWLHTVTLPQINHWQGRRHQQQQATVAADFPGVSQLLTVKISHTAFSSANMAAGLATWLNCAVSLEQLDLSECSGAVAQLVAGLTGHQLRLLNMSSSQLSSSELPETVFKQLAQLQVLDLSHNRLARLPAGLLGRIQRLTHLYLQHNAISALTKQSFLGINCLIKLPAYQTFCTCCLEKMENLLC